MAEYDTDAARQVELWERWAALIPDLYPDRDPSAIVEFLASQPGPHLDLGAGSGRIAVPLAERGCDVTAVEVAPAFVGRLRDQAGAVPRLQAVEGDMASLALEKRFGSVFAVRSTFFQLGTVDRQIGCLEAVASHLAEGGRLILDCFVPDLELLRTGGCVQMTGWSGDGVEIRACSADQVTQRMVYRELRIKDGAVPRVLPVEQRFCWPSELDAMAYAAGLVLQDRWGDWAGAPFTAGSRRHVSVYSQRNPRIRR